MQTLEGLRRKIDTATDLHSVVKTMKTLAAVSIRQYERAVDALSDYNRTVELGFQIVLRESEFVDQVFVPRGQRHSQKLAAIVFGSDQGMCGQFNERIAKLVRDSQEASTERRKIFAVGARVEAHLSELDLPPDQTFRVPSSVSEITTLVQNLLLSVDRWREESEVNCLEVFFNRRTKGASCEATQLKILPIDSERYHRWSGQPWDSRSLPLFTMDRRRLLSCVVSQYLFVTLFRSSAESLSSENASRIAAMQVAEKSIEQRLDDLHGAFHQIRQTAITEELLDVVSGFEALSERSE